jgi:hypothetical protein
MKRCAWCGTVIPAGCECFGVKMRLRPEAYRLVKFGAVQPMVLPKAGKTVAIIVVALDSPAKRQGVDAMFQLCSDACGIALQKALRDEGIAPAADL